MVERLHAGGLELYHARVSMQELYSLLIGGEIHAGKIRKVL
jgi:hypothetical protein